MALLSDSAIAAVARQGGFSGGGLVMAIAIALAESGGNTQAQGFNRDSSGRVSSVDRGLWQINNFYHSEVSDNCAYDPNCAAGAAFRISAHGTNWQPWSTYMNGAYRQYLVRAQRAAGQVTPAGGTTPSGQLPPPPAPLSTGTPQAVPLASLLAAPADLSVTTQSMGDTSKDLMGPYKLIMALVVMFGFLYVLSKTRAGYVAIYYGEVLILFFLFATQAQYFREALLPLAPQHAETPAGLVTTTL